MVVYIANELIVKQQGPLKATIEENHSNELHELVDAKSEIRKRCKSTMKLCEHNSTEHRSTWLGTSITGMCSCWAAEPGSSERHPTQKVF